MANVFRTPAILTKISSRADRSYTLTFNTQELAPVDVAEISQYLQGFGTVAFAVNDQQLEELDSLEAPEEIVEQGSKTKSERLRGVLFALWEYKHKEKYKTFDLFYSVYMEQVIDNVKRNLPAR